MKMKEKLIADSTSQLPSALAFRGSRIRDSYARISVKSSYTKPPIQLQKILKFPSNLDSNETKGI